jgi:hypothetical protein
MRASSIALVWVSKASTVDFRRACSLSLACAFSLSLQKSGWPASASSSAIFDRLPATSKMPPENVQTAFQLDDAFSQGPDFHGAET